MNKYVRITLCVHNVFMNALTIVGVDLQDHFNAFMDKANLHQIKGLKIDWMYISSYILKINFKPPVTMAQCIHEHIMNTLAKNPSKPHTEMAKVFIGLDEQIVSLLHPRIHGHRANLKGAL